jgi:TonB-linked SusC/RagA family outer membrane protein
MKQQLLKIILSYLIINGSSADFFAQLTLKGRILDSQTQETIIGAVVTEKGTKNTTISDWDGSFSMNVTGMNCILVVSYLGYAETEIEVTSNPMDLLISEDENILNQVVVVGYGLQKKSDLTGSVSSLKGKDIEKIPTPNVEQALQGKIPGVYVSPASGAPGSGAVVRIRGTGTLNNSNPLYVIDGMITQDATTVNPQDVESVEVLKDASAAAIYGSRGANGVIIITTKNGRNAKNAQISIASYYGQQKVVKKIDMLTGSEFAKAYNQLTKRNFYPNPDSIGEGTNWQKEIFRSAPIANIQVGALGGNEKFSYNLSGNLFSQEGILKNTNFNRAAIRFNTEMRLKPWLTIGNNASFSLIKEQLGPNVVSGAYRIPSVLPVFNADGEYQDPTFFGLAIANPVADQFYKSNHYKNTHTLLGNLYGEVSFWKYFRFRSNFGYNLSNFKQRYYEPIFTVSPSQLNKFDRLSLRYETPDRNWIWEQTLHYLREWGDHSLGVLAGYTAEERESEFFGASRESFPGNTDDVIFLSSGNDTTQMNFGGASDEALVSILFRTNYTLRHKYLVTASLRVDQSSRFNPDNRTGYFPSGSIGWNIGQEPFVQSWNTFDRLKLRLSYGILGNQALGDRYPTAAIIYSGQNAIFGTGENLNQGATQLSIINEKLKWEVSNQLDFGIEGGILNDQLGFEIDWFRRHTYDIIAAIPIPDYLGSAASPFVNTAEVLNTGFDIGINWRQAGEFAYNIGLNLSPIKNEVLALAKGKSEIFDAFINSEPATRTVVGQPIGGFFGYMTDGIFQNEEELAQGPRLGGEGVGDLRYKDLNSDGKVTSLDRTYLGSPIPKLTYGLNLGSNFKGFDLGMDIFGVYGNKVYNEKATTRFGIYNWESRVANAWTTEKPSESEPRVTVGGHNYLVSDRYIEDGSFVRLRALNLGYTIPEMWLKKMKTTYMRIFASGQNLWTLQKFTGYNPEFPSGGSPFRVGFDGGQYPIAKSYQVGLELKF